MPDFPSNNPVPAVISSMSFFAVGPQLNAVFSGLGVASAVYPTANLGIYVPFWLPAPFVLRQMFVGNGAAVSGNIDAGVYADDGSLIVSKGSTAQAGTSVLQHLTVTETIIPAGRYYMGVSCDNTTATLQRCTPSVVALQTVGVLQAASQLPLTTAPTLASVANAYMPLIGISSITTF